MIYRLLIIVALTFFIGCRSSSPNFTNELIGKWRVQNASILPFTYISFCDSVNIGSIFNFKNNGDLQVYYKNEKKHCNRKQSFELDSNNIIVQEWDVFFKYKIVTLNKDSLQFVIPDNILANNLDINSENQIDWTNSTSNTKTNQKEIKVLLTRVLSN